MREALDIDLEIFGNNHAQVATDMNNLGMLLLEQV